jgi:hypothetical protein
MAERHAHAVKADLLPRCGVAEHLTNGWSGCPHLARILAGAGKVNGKKDGILEPNKTH